MPSPNSALSKQRHLSLLRNYSVTTPTNLQKMSDTILAKNIDTSKLKYSDVKILSNGSKTVYINYGSDKLTIQTPFMSLPYGVGDWNSADADKKKEDFAGKKYDLHLSFRDWEDNSKLRVLLDKMKDIETKLKEDAFANRLAWFNDDFDDSKALVDRLFTPILKYDKDKKTGKIVGKYPPTLKVKLPYDNKVDDFSFECSDTNGNDIDFKSMMTKLKGAKARVIIQLSGIWMAGGKYGVTWKVVKGTFDMPSKSKYDYIEDSDEELNAAAVEGDDELDEEAMAMANITKKTSTLVVESDDEEEPVPKKKPVATKVVVEEPEEDEEEAEEEEDLVDSDVDNEPTPPPPPKKKAVSKTTRK